MAPQLAAHPGWALIYPQDVDRHSSRSKTAALLSLMVFLELIPDPLEVSDNISDDVFSVNMPISQQRGRPSSSRIPQLVRAVASTPAPTPPARPPSSHFPHLDFQPPLTTRRLTYQQLTNLPPPPPPSRMLTPTPTPTHSADSRHSVYTGQTQPSPTPSPAGSRMTLPPHLSFTPSSSTAQFSRPSTRTSPQTPILAITLPPTIARPKRTTRSTSNQHVNNTIISILLTNNI